MSWPTVMGLPLHPLVVHATVVLVPLAAVAVLLHTFWPAARGPARSRDPAGDGHGGGSRADLDQHR